MKLLLAPFVFAGALTAGTSGTLVTAVDPQTNMPAARPLTAVAYAGRTHATQIVDVNDQLSDQERALIAFSRLRSEAGQRGH